MDGWMNEWMGGWSGDDASDGMASRTPGGEPQGETNTGTTGQSLPPCAQRANEQQHDNCTGRKRQNQGKSHAREEANINGCKQQRLTQQPIPSSMRQAHAWHNGPCMDRAGRGGRA